MNDTIAGLYNSSGFWYNEIRIKFPNAVERFAHYFHIALHRAYKHRVGTKIIEPFGTAGKESLYLLTSVLDVHQARLNIFIHKPIVLCGLYWCEARCF